MSAVPRTQLQVYFFYSSITFTFLPYFAYCVILFFAAQLIHSPEVLRLPLPFAFFAARSADSPTSRSSCAHEMLARRVA